MRPVALAKSAGLLVAPVERAGQVRLVAPAVWPVLVVSPVIVALMVPEIYKWLRRTL